MTWHAPTMKQMLLSITCKSFEKRFKINPVGVTSKNVFTGAFITFDIIYSCNDRDPLIDIINNIHALKNTKIPVPAAYENESMVNHLN